MKTQAQENFPVASYLFPQSYRALITHYYNFARYCDDIADNPRLSKAQKIKNLDTAEQALYGKEKLSVAGILRQDFLKEQFDFSLATDLLVAFRRDAENFSYKTWSQLLDYCQYSAAPVGRFMLALFNENPSTYLPSNALCTVLQIVNHIQDLSDDLHLLNRCYLPEELLKQYKVSSKALRASVSSKNLQFLLNDVLKRCHHLMKDAEILPAITKSLRLRLYICVTIVLTNILLNKLYNHDVLAQKIRLSKFDKMKAVVLGFWLALTTKRKTLDCKEL